MSLEGQAAPVGAVVGATSGATPTSGGGDSSFDIADARAKANAFLAGQDAAEGEPSAEPAAAEAAPAPPEQEQKPKPEGTEDELNRNWVRLRNQEARFKERIAKERSEVAAQRAELERIKAEAMSLEERRAKAKSSPLAALQELGWSFEQLVDYVGKNGQIPQERIIQDLKLQFDEKLTEQQKALEELKAERAQAERAKLIGDFEGKVIEEVKGTLTGYPHLEKFVAKFGMDKLLPKVFQQLHQNALQKNFLPPSTVLRNFEEELSQVAPIFLAPSPAQGGAGSGPANPEAAKPPTTRRPEPLSNDDGSERGVSDAADDEDLETLRKRAKAVLSGG